jgi:phage terminase large subunit
MGRRSRIDSNDILTIRTAPAFQPLLKPARYKGAWGGRGSGKSHFFAGLAVQACAMNKGMLIVCIREIQKTLKESAKRLIESKLAQYNLGEAAGFRIYGDCIQTPGDGLIIFQGMLDHTAESIKSLEGYQRAWVEEGQTLSQRSLDLLRPTIRTAGSELWFSWNPTRRTDPVDVMFRAGEPPTNSKCVHARWQHNPWWNATLEQERVDCYNTMPDQYDHIWEGDYARILTGAYYASALTALRSEGRFTKLAPDPLISYRAFWDLGGTGAKADHTVIWIGQFVGREIRVLDFYEAQGQPLATHVHWLRENGYANALMVLPHDAEAHDKVFSVSYETALQSAGFDTQVVPNQGRAAAMNRIEATRRLFPRIWIDEERCAGGIDALGSYHAKRDEHRLIDLGPEHDWASHASDAFGLMCVSYDEPRARKYKPAYDSQRSWLSI